MSLFLVVALPFLGAVLPPLMIRTGRNACATTTFFVTLLALLGLLTHLPAVLNGETVTARLAWMPGLGLDANFMIDGLGFFFAALILGIGLLIIAYARFYLSREDDMGEFYAYLLLFQGAMVGIVLSDNILMLLIFWELTSLSSFLLIGFWKHLEEGRQGARMALVVTGLGGLAMIGGMLLLGQVAGSYDLSVILEKRDAIQASPLYTPALLLILLGCFTKSAQFPFHFWLPHAMAAPTPVSAYLHSATMVKAGIFLMARLWPVLSGSTTWFILVTGIGLLTMVMAAVIALFKNDLKALLAFSTVSHLGLMTMLLGTGTAFGAMAAVFHVLNHATFKAALFMSAGIIDHEAGTRDITRLGGLRRLMPVTFVISTLASLSMAGIPFLNGFLSKEMMLQETTHTVLFGNPMLVPVLATIGALFSAAYAFRLVAHVFFGPRQEDNPGLPHDPPFGMWAPPALLVVAVVAFGVAPVLVEPFIRVVTEAVIGTAAQLPEEHIRIWHGLSTALGMSAVAVAGAILILLLFPPLARAWAAAGPPFAKTIYDALIEGLVAMARVFAAGLHNGALTRYAAIFVVTVVAISGHAWLSGTMAPPTRAPMPVTALPVVGWLLLVVASLWLLRQHRNRFLALILTGVVGLIVSVGFAYLSAPDLALTQLSVEVVSVILLLLALNFLPRQTPVESRPARRLRDGVIALAAGAGAGGLIYSLMVRDFTQTPISAFHLANSHTIAGGNNVVNVILVDFRGFDTFGEIIVLGIAALIIYAVTETLLSGRVRARLLNRPDDDVAGGAHPMMMVVVTRVMMPVVLMVGLYIFLRGHNDPGGGFIAGLVVSIAMVMQYMASGFDWAAARMRCRYHTIIGTGVLVAGLTGIGAWFFGAEFLTSSYGYFPFGWLGEAELASAMGFDLGVFLCVVGAVMLSLESFSRLGRRAGEEVSEYPMDINPSREDQDAASAAGREG